MELRARIQPLPRRAAMMAACVAMLVTALAAAILPADADAKKKRKAPVVTKVSPLDVAVGETLTIRGRNFVRGRNKNTVVFKRDGARAVFVKASFGTTKMLSLKVPDTLQQYFALTAGVPKPTRFRLRVLSRKFAKKYTSKRLSPIVSAPRAAPEKTPEDAKPDGDCDGDEVKNKLDTDDDNDGLSDDLEKEFGTDLCKADTDKDGILDKWEFDCDRNGVLNRDESDDDKDLLPDALEIQIGTDPCKIDTDSDTVEDGYEFKSAQDLNDDDHQAPNANLPYPHKTPYPNPLFADAETDHDGDAIMLVDEQRLWKYTYTVNHTATRTLLGLSYSAGLKHSLFRYENGDHGRRLPDQPWGTYEMTNKFQAWANQNGYGTVRIESNIPFRTTSDMALHDVSGTYDLRDIDLSGFVEIDEASPNDFDRNGYVSDTERDEDADGLANVTELSVQMQPGYWSACYGKEQPWREPYSATQVDDGDTDGDGVLDGADDQDFDDVPNMLELSRMAASDFNDLSGTAVCEIHEDIEKTDTNPQDGQTDKLILWHNEHYGRVHPFNPCMPFLDSETCPSFVPVGAKPGAPFDTSINWVALQ